MAENSQTVEKAIAFALAQVGKPYVYGAVGPNSFDCSSLLWRAYQTGGIDISRSTGTQRLKGVSVAGEWLPGDLLFSRSPLSPSGNHVKMYIGGGRIVEAANRKDGIRVASAPAKSELNDVRRYVKSLQTAYKPQYQKAGFGFDDLLKNPFGKAADDLGPVGDAIGGYFDPDNKWGLGFLPWVAGGADEAIDGTKAVFDAAAFIINPHNWYRVGMFILGGALLYVALKAAGNAGPSLATLKNGVTT